MEDSEATAKKAEKQFFALAERFLSANDPVERSALKAQLAEQVVGPQHSSSENTSS